MALFLGNYQLETRQTLRKAYHAIRNVHALSWSKISLHCIGQQGHEQSASREEIEPPHDSNQQRSQITEAASKVNEFPPYAGERSDTYVR
jgi:hypothetical protein